MHSILERPDSVSLHPHRQPSDPAHSPPDPSPPGRSFSQAQTEPPDVRVSSMQFPPTRLSVVARTRSHDEETRRVALGTLIEAYWKPVYKYLRIKWRLDPDEAADLTQDFFTTALEK